MTGKSIPLIDERTVTIQTRYGKMTLLEGDSVIGRSLQVYGEWAQNEIALVSRFLEKGAVAVDAGANIGTHALAFAHYVGSTGRVLAFEPQQDLFVLLYKNLKDNSAEQVDAVCAALSDRHEILYVPHRGLTAGMNSGAVSLLKDPPRDQEAIPVEATPLDDLHLERCDLIKADVEGMELRILKGAESTLSRCMPVLYLECNTTTHAIRIFEYLHDKPYSLYLHKAPAFNPANFFGSGDRIFGAAYESSILAVPLHKHTELVLQLASNAQIVAIDTIEDVTATMAEAEMIVDLRGALSEAERLATEGQAEIRRYDEALTDAQQLVLQRDQEIARLRSALADAEQLAFKGREELERYAEGLTEAQRLIAQRDQEIAQLRPALAHAERLAYEEQEELRRYAEGLAEAQRLVAKRDQEIDQLRPALGEAEALASKRHDELKTMRERLIRLERESLLLEQRLAAIENSFAWRVIAPLRKFGPARGTRRG